MKKEFVLVNGLVRLWHDVARVLDDTTIDDILFYVCCDKIFCECEPNKLEKAGKIVHKVYEFCQEQKKRERDFLNSL